jgi:hypothetical protein
MTHIVVDDQQARLITQTTEFIEIRDRAGQHLGYVAHSFSADDVVIAKQRAASSEPRFTTAQVLSHLETLSRQ